MEFSVKDRLLSLIFPALCVVYGILELLSGVRHIYKAAGVAAIAAGIVVGSLILIFKINIVGYLKILTISTVVSFLMWYTVGARFPVSAIHDIISNIFNIGVLFGSVVISTLNMPEHTPVRDRLIVFFSNPVLYSLLNWLWRIIYGFLVDSGAIVL